MIGQVTDPASVIYLSENNATSTVDHFPPYCWNANDPLTPSFCPFMAPFFDSNNEPLSLATRIHQGGLVSMYVDGHAKWGQWSQLWFQNAAAGVYEGYFDPRQQ